MSVILEMIQLSTEPDGRFKLFLHTYFVLWSFPQVRVALKDWEHVRSFEEDARDAQHWDAVYILQQMLSRKAFYFTAMPTLVSCLFHQRHCGQVDHPASRVKASALSLTRR